MSWQHLNVDGERHPLWMRIAAGRLHMDVEEYAEHVHRGEAWCSGHRAWEPRTAFYTSTARSIGVQWQCKALMDADYRARRAR